MLHQFLLDIGGQIGGMSLEVEGPKRRPPNGQVIHLGDLDDLAERGKVTLLPPTYEFIRSQLDFWDNFITQSVRDERDDLEKFGRLIYRQTLHMLQVREQINKAISEGGDEERMQELINVLLEWHQRMGALTGFTELVSQPAIEELVRDPTIDEDDGEGIFMVDVDSRQYKSTGIHVDDTLLSRLGLVAPEPGTENWYAGDTFYVRTQRPAHVSVGLQERVGRERKLRVERVALTSLAGRVKTNRWQQASSQT